MSTSSSSVLLVSLADARRIADDLLEGAVAPHTQSSVRHGYIKKLHTLVYQLLADRNGRNQATVAIGRCARPASWTKAGAR